MDSGCELCNYLVMTNRSRTYSANPANAAKIAARVQCSEAIRKGVLVRVGCEVCGAIKAEAHHDDYSRPLAVRWLCKKCHGIAHRGQTRSRKTYCQRGHELAGHNVILTTRGDGLAARRKCRACTKLKTK